MAKNKFGKTVKVDSPYAIYKNDRTNFEHRVLKTYQTKDNREEHVWATSWGVSTRLIGAVILTHGDEKGLRLPPKIAPIQLVIIPITKTKEESKSLKLYLEPITNSLKMVQIRFHEDWSSNSPGFKFNDWEMKGVPLRLEIGPRDMANNTVVLARRDNKNKIEIDQSSVGEEVSKLLDEIQSELFNQAEKFRNENTRRVSDYNDFKKTMKKGGFVRCGWDGLESTELKIKEETSATIRCIPFDEETENLKCILTGVPAKHEVIFAKAY